MTGDTGPDDDSAEGDPDDAPPADAGAGSDDASPDDPGGGRPADGGRAEPAGDTGPPGSSPGGGPSGTPGRPGDDRDDRHVDPERVEALDAELANLRSELDGLESRVDEKTVHRDDLEAELRRYVRARQRRGHATGWGPYLVLLYGVVMTVGAFYYMGSWPAILAMVVIWLSTLGLYVVMIFVGAGVGAVRKVASIRDVVGKLRG